MKKSFCDILSSNLDSYYDAIAAFLYEDLEVQGVDESGLGLQVDFLCKNYTDSPEDPGVRDIASFTRWDYIEKCNQADQAKCWSQLADAVSNGELLYSKYYPSEKGGVGEIEYVAEDPKYHDEMITSEGYDLEFNCSYSYIYQEKSLPFDPDLLNNTCGDAGYGYYVDG